MNRHPIDFHLTAFDVAEPSCTQSIINEAMNFDDDEGFYKDINTSNQGQI